VLRCSGSNRRGKRRLNQKREKAKRGGFSAQEFSPGRPGVSPSLQKRQYANNTESGGATLHNAIQSYQKHRDGLGMFFPDHGQIFNKSLANLLNPD
jgi:hypothetical protein